MNGQFIDYSCLLYYSNNTTGKWITEELDADLKASHARFLYPFAALGSDSNVHISYSDYLDAGILNYTTNAEGTWATTPVDSDPDWDHHHSNAVASAIIMDEGGKAHIAYRAIFLDGRHEIKYATNSM
jgi:hypothetical protein